MFFHGEAEPRAGLDCNNRMQKLLHTTPPATTYKTVTTIVVSTSTPIAPTNTVITTSAVTVTSPAICSTTVTQQQALSTSCGFTQQHVIKKRHEEKRQDAYVVQVKEVLPMN
jgi:hypothetical protein